MGKGETISTGAPTTLWNKNFIMVMFLGLLTQGSSMMVTTLIAKYAVSLGAELGIAATISSTLSIVALCCRPFSGIIADTLNRKMIMLVSTLVTGICMLCYAMFPSISSLVAFRIVHGIAFAFMGVAQMAFGTTFIPNDRMGEGIGYLSLGMMLAQAVGPSIGLSLSQNYGYATVFYITAVVVALGLVMIWFIPYKHISAPKGEKRKITLHSIIEPRVIFFALILCLFSSGNGLMNTYAALLGEERGISNIALFFTAYSVATLCSRPFVGKLLDKKGLTVVLVPAIILAACGMCLVASANALWMIIVAGCLKAIGQGSATPSIQAVSIKKLGRERAGVISSTCYIGQDIGNAFAPIIGSYIVKSSGYGTLFFGYAGVLLVGGLALYALYLFSEKKIEERKA